jgi:hypothetical protein
MMLKWTTLAVAVTCACLLSPPSYAESHDDLALGELVDILRAQGVLNEDQYRSVSAKAAAQDRANEEDWTDKITAWGDFRARYETFSYSDEGDFVDSSGNGIFDDRSRFRYRLRFNVKANVHEYADVFFRLSTGRDGRTRNETLGANVDFNTDEIFLDNAYVRISPFAEGGKLPDHNGTLNFYFGRTKMPWRWDSVFKDWLLWDDEFAPAGGYADLRLQLNEQLKVYASGGMYYLDENGNSKSPKLGHAQVGFHAQPGDGRFDVGGRSTWFNLSSLDDGFMNRGVNLGNTGTCAYTAGAPLQPPTRTGCTTYGLTGDRNGGAADVLEFGAYAGARLIERWPMLIVADMSTNLDATGERVTTPTGTFRTGDDDLAWLVGFQIGDSKEVVRFRMHYAELEANAFPAQLVDSDLFDGLTNRKGFVWDLTKRVMKNTDASVTAFLSDRLEDGEGYLNSTAGAKRFRLQANMVWSF